MMGEDQEQLFFDVESSFASSPDYSSCSPDRDTRGLEVENACSCSFQYGVWTQCPNSVKDRRRKFLKSVGLSFGDSVVKEESLVDFIESGDEIIGEEENCDRIRESSGAVLRSAVLEDEIPSNRASLSSWSGSSRQSGSGESFVSQFRSLENSGPGNEVVSQTSEFEVSGRLAKTLQKVKSRLRYLSCMVNGESTFEGVRSDEPETCPKVRRIRVRQNKKRVKELSALFKGQEIEAHDGSILAMKFSCDSKYLASGGEDGVVRVWGVVEDERSNEDVDIQNVDTSCIYFTVSKLSELEPIIVEKERLSKMRNMRRTADSACVVFPPQVFRLTEKPVHEFYGHGAEILDLSWSKNNCLLSAAADNTVRLWRVGSDECLDVFSHCNYVTCVQFNPVDDNIFISGSIDGKVRIWTISGCHVVDWTDISDIVTAVAYRPDAKGGVIGSLTGSCRFFSISDNHFQLESHLCLNNKKKSQFKRITGFEFLPQDPSKVMVTCADSHVRIIQGGTVIGKYKGLRNAGNQISASFTSDGKHIVSASEDSQVYFWNYANQEEQSIFQSKTVNSFESFATDASIAIPWSGATRPGDENRPHQQPLGPNSHNPFCFSLGREFFLEYMIPKGSATWPEENLPPSSPRAFSSSLRKSHYKFLKACQNSSSSNVWGLVIVTAGWDGKIRSFHNYGLPVPC